MSFMRATDPQVQAIKNLCFNRSNLIIVLYTFERLKKESLDQLSIVDAADLIGTLQRGAVP
jgi:hypothetical protein